MTRTVLLVLASYATVATTGSVYRGQHTHIGVRPSTDGDGLAATVQVTTDACDTPHPLGVDISHCVWVEYEAGEPCEHPPCFHCASGARQIP